MTQNQRAHTRLVPSRAEEFRVNVSLEGRVLEAKLVDYSAFGMGALLPDSPGLQESLRVGSVLALQCLFGDSRFPSRGKVANVSQFSDEHGTWVRVGFALVSEATPVRERLSQRRAQLRLEVDEHLSPLCVCEDDLRFGNRIFMRARDVSAGGFALELPTDRVPFLPKQRLWMRIFLPFFGELKALVRVAYVKKIAGDAQVKPPGGALKDCHLVGVTLLRSVSDVSGVLCDYLYFTHGEFERHELRAAGFDVGHLGGVEHGQRVRIVRSQGASSWSVDEIEFHVENVQGEILANATLGLEAGGSRFVLKAFIAQGEASLGALLQFLMLYGYAHSCEMVHVLPQAREGLQPVWPQVPESMAFPQSLATSVPFRALLALAPLYRSRLQAPPGPRGTLLKAVGTLGGVFEL